MLLTPNLEALACEHAQGVFPDCQHQTTKVVKWTTSNGVVKVSDHCQLCGRRVRDRRKAEFLLSTLPWEDKSIQESYDKQRHEYYEKRRDRLYEEHEERRQADKAAWFKRHDNYLNTEQWKERRRLVFLRTKGMCQARLPGCLINASEVHHLTYDRCPTTIGWGCEPLFDLVAVCRPCHDFITSMGRTAK